VDLAGKPGTQGRFQLSQSERGPYYRDSREARPGHQGRDHSNAQAPILSFGSNRLNTGDIEVLNPNHKGRSQGHNREIMKNWEKKNYIILFNKTKINNEIIQYDNFSRKTY
jgi:hypothetical protein